MRRFIRAIGCIGLLALVGCGGDSGGSNEGVTPPGVMIHYPTMAFYDDQELLVTYSISYNNATNFVESPRRDGIWLARITPPKTIDETKPRRSLKTILVDSDSSSNRIL